MEASKSVQARFKLPTCPCHLCTKKVFSEYDEELGIDAYIFNGTAYYAHEVDQCQPPNLFCIYRQMWVSLYWPCCCQANHMNPEDCTLNGSKSNPCGCSRCCKVCWQGAFLDPRPSKNSLECNCSKKDRFYVPCKHLRGYCKP